MSFCSLFCTYHLASVAGQHMTRLFGLHYLAIYLDSVYTMSTFMMHSTVFDSLY